VDDLATVPAMNDPVDQRQAVRAEVAEQLLLNMILAQSMIEIQAKALQEAEQLARVDPLTQLPNRVLLFDRCAQAIAHAHRHRGRLALLFVDIDRFKEINDHSGHLAGDRALRSAARRVLAAIREVDTVCRFGGDEFIVLISEMTVPDDATMIAAKILAALVKGDADTPGLDASIGISVYPEDGADTEILITRADAAMFSAKATGGGTWARFGEIATRPGTSRSSSPIWSPDAKSPTGPLRCDGSRVEVRNGSPISRRIVEGSHTVRFRAYGSHDSGDTLVDGHDPAGHASGYWFSGDVRVSDGRATASVIVRIDDRDDDGSTSEKDFAVQMTGVVEGAGLSLRGVGPGGAVVIEIDCAEHQDLED
jgi:diguanylate cyclase (GGDEF)-like protein